MVKEGDLLLTDPLYSQRLNSLISEVLQEKPSVWLPLAPPWLLHLLLKVLELAKKKVLAELALLTVCSISCIVRPGGMKVNPSL